MSESFLLCKFCVQINYVFIISNWLRDVGAIRHVLLYLIVVCLCCICTAQFFREIVALFLAVRRSIPIIHVIHMSLDVLDGLGGAK